MDSVREVMCSASRKGLLWEKKCVQSARGTFRCATRPISPLNLCRTSEKGSTQVRPGDEARLYCTDLYSRERLSITQYLRVPCSFSSSQLQSSSQNRMNGGISDDPGNKKSPWPLPADFVCQFVRAKCSNHTRLGIIREMDAEISAIGILLR